MQKKILFKTHHQDFTFNSLTDLKQLKKVMQVRAQKIQKAKQQQQQRAHQNKADSALFRQYIGKVTPLKSYDKVIIDSPKPAPVPTQRQQDEQQVLHEAISDEFDVETLLDTDDTLSYRRVGIGADVVRKLRKGHWTLQAQLDLHGYRREEARTKLSVFLREASKQGLRCVRIVHGKGLGSPGKTPVLKNKVLSWLAQKEEVLAYTQARAAEGGAGALIVLLSSTPHHM